MGTLISCFFHFNDCRVPSYSIMESVKFSQVKFQYVAVFGGLIESKILLRCLLQLKTLSFIVNIISFCHGFAVGWLSPATPILKSKDTPLLSGPLTLEQTMWLGGVYHMGAVLGNCVFGVLVNYFGRTTPMSLLALPNIVSR